jgi:hypothetical protein
MLLILNYEKWSYQKLKELNTLENVTFQLPNGTYVPEHFHVTEVVYYQKFHWLWWKGKKRNRSKLPIVGCHDFEHRLKPKKTLDIIELSEKF